MDSKATDPTQYDALNWSAAGAEDNPSREWFRAALDALVPDGALAGKRVVDIGCGVGQLFTWLKRKGAAEVWGFDPSAHNVAAATAAYPGARVSQALLHEFAAHNTQPFDAAAVVMVLEYTPDICEALKDIASLLAPGGALYLVAGDYDYFTGSDLSVRGKYVVGVEVVRRLPDGAAEVATTRNEPGVGRTVMHEIFRPIAQVRTAALEAGLSVVRERPMAGLPWPDGRPSVACHTFVLHKQP